MSMSMQAGNHTSQLKCRFIPCLFFTRLCKAYVASPQEHNELYVLADLNHVKANLYTRNERELQSSEPDLDMNFSNMR